MTPTFIVPPAFIVTGTDTGIGKTLFSAGLVARLGASYWKPVQSGLEEETDSQTVARLTGAFCPPEAYRLRLPASPHLSADAEGLQIDDSALTNRLNAGGYTTLNKSLTQLWADHVVADPEYSVRMRPDTLRMRSIECLTASSTPT